MARKAVRVATAAPVVADTDAAPAADTPPVPALIAEWLQYLGKERQMSVHTITAYTSDLARFTTYLGAKAQGASWDWGTVDRNTIRGFLGFLSRQGLERRSIARTLSAVRGFYRYLHRDEHVSANPARSVRTPKIGRHLPAHLDSGTMQTLMDAASTRAQGGAYADVRNLAMLELFYATGMRLSELYGLDRGDVDLVSLRVKVRGKGRKERIIPFGGPARLANINYESRRDELVRAIGSKADRNAWFLNPRGRRLSRRGIQLAMTGLIALVDAPEGASVHALREAQIRFALEPMDSGVCRMAIVLDPDGNSLAIHQRKAT